MSIFSDDLPVICLMGPTASGKTDLAVELVQTFPCEIVSVDSAMVYRGMDIGTAKPTRDILQIAPHWLIDVCDPAEAYSAARFCEEASAAITAIHAQQKIPLLVGGTMLYFRALLKGFSDLPSAHPLIREQITQTAHTVGWPALHAKLAQFDPMVAARIHPHDSQRIQRALEVFYVSGKSMSQLQNKNYFLLENKKIITLALIPEDRAILHERIALRFQKMLADGFVEEVKTLFDRGDLTQETPAMRAAGYQQVWQYVSGEWCFNHMCERGVIATRQLAKRQLTWLRHWVGLDAVFASEAADVVKQVKKFLKNLF